MLTNTVLKPVFKEVSTVNINSSNNNENDIQVGYRCLQLNTKKD